MKKCQKADCERDAAWEIPNYFNKGSEAERKLGTRSQLECEDHGKESMAINPFQDWKRIAS